MRLKGVNLLYFFIEGIEVFLIVVKKFGNEFEHTGGILTRLAGYWKPFDTYYLKNTLELISNF